MIDRNEGRLARRQVFEVEDRGLWPQRLGQTTEDWLPLEVACRYCRMHEPLAERLVAQGLVPSKRHGKMVLITRQGLAEGFARSCAARKGCTV